MRLRHHTDDAGLANIQATGEIRAARGWLFVHEGGTLEIEQGVHVELELFGSPKPGAHGPIGEMACYAEGAYVEFDLPPGRELFRYSCGPRNTGLIPMPSGEALKVADLNPRFVRVRRYWWQFWRFRSE